VWVGGGNHSLTAGIVQHTGCVTPRAVLDISPVFAHVRAGDGRRIAPVASLELAAIFEIGGLMHAHGLSAWPASARPSP
jgi:hypothetical protein